MTLRPHRSRRRARGAAAVEFALVLPLLMLIVLGAIDWGWYFFIRSVAVNAAREGARTGTLYLTDADSESNAHAAAIAYVTAGALNGASATVTEDVVRVRVDPDGTPVDNVWVRVRYPVGSLTGFLTAIMPTEVDVRADMRR